MPLSLVELMAIFEKEGDGFAIVSDDAGHWAAVTNGTQNIPDGYPADMWMSFHIKASEWKPTIAEALQAYYDEYVACGDTPDSEAAS